MATKKTTRKKANTAAPKPASGKFDLFSSDIVSHTQEAVHALRARKKNKGVTLKSLANVKRYLLDIDNFALQATFGTRGLRGRTVLEIIAQEGIGKTTLVFTLLGALMRLNQSPCLFVNTEGDNKLPNPERIKRCLDSDPAIADKMLNAIAIEPGREIRHAVESIEEFVRATRKYLDDNGGEHVPIVVAIDTLSKLMSPGEAAGLLDEEDAGKPSKVKDLGGGSKLEFSGLMHAWSRRLNFWMDTYNVLFILVSHQNAKIDMSGFGSNMSAEVSAGYNKTKFGGSATNQISAMQTTLKRTGFAKNSTSQIGHKIQMRVVKSSVGADHNTLDYVLKTRDFTGDIPGEYQEPALDFSEGLANMFAERKILNTTVKLKRYTSEELGVSGVSAVEFYDEFMQRPDLQAKVGLQLGIEGYVDADLIPVAEPETADV